MKPIDPRLWLKIKDWPEERLFEWNERAAIIEYDGNTPRIIAEQQAYEQLNANPDQRSKKNNPHRD